MDRIKTYVDGTRQRTKMYWVWCAMKQRCYNPKDKGYKNYGGRGIKVCDRWLNDYPTFLMDMGEQPPGMSIDRIDNDGDYSPENCRWTTRSLQTLNQRERQVYNQNGFRGVRWNKKANKWAAVIAKDGKRHYLGSFSTPADAAKAYNEAALKHHGRYATLNVIDE